MAVLAALSGSEKDLVSDARSRNVKNAEEETKTADENKFVGILGRMLSSLLSKKCKVTI